MNHVLYCSCGEVIVKSLDADTKIRSKVIVVRDGNAFAICKGCNGEVKIPLVMDGELLKSMTATSEHPKNLKHVPLYIRNVRKTS